MEKETTEFGKQASHADGLRSHCRLCRKEAAAKLYIIKKAIILSKNKQWRASNKEKANNYNNLWWRLNPDKRRKKEYIYLKAKPEKRRTKNTNSRARRIGAQGSHTANEWSDVVNYFNNSCAYCLNVYSTFTKDHITALINGGSNYISNIVPACRSCNSQKGTKSLLIYTYAK